MKKRVYFVHGFDFRGMAYYYQALLKAKPDNVRISPLENGRFVMDDDIEYVFLDWSGEVSQLMRRGPRLVLALLLGYARYLTSGMHGFIKRFDAKTAFLITVPLGLFLGLALFGLSGFLFGWWPGVGTVLAMALICAVLFRKTGLDWLCNIFLFLFSTDVGSHIQRVSTRFADRILALEATDPADEVVYVSHSVGTLFSAPVVARLLEMNAPLEDRLTVLTFGNILPGVMYRPSAHLLDSLQRLAGRKALVWHDFTANADPLCFHRTDAFRMANMAGSPIQFRSLAFIHMFSPESWKRIRRNKLRVHFLYFRAYERDRGYSYFDLLRAHDTRQYLEQLKA